MPAALKLSAGHDDLVAAYTGALRSAGRGTGHSTVLAARSFCAKLERAQGWEGMTRSRQLDAARKARAFISWLMVTGQLTVDADLLCTVVFRLGNAARNFCPEAHAWFLSAAEQIGTGHHDTVTQWNVLAKITAITGIPPDQVGESDFAAAESALVGAYAARDRPESGRNLASMFHRLRLPFSTPDTSTSSGGQRPSLR